MDTTRAEARFASTDLHQDIAFFTKRLGMRMDMIFPADNPRIARFSGHGIALSVEQGTDAPQGSLRIATADPDGFARGKRQLIAPGGTSIEIVEADPPLTLPETEHVFATRRLADGASWVIGRAGMQYRDLVPGRLGGAMIASHIRIAEAGDVPDMVHFHKVGFQLIFCINGWVDVVYEDQGDPIRLTPGACFIQPPEIRHRVLRSGDGLEVIEIGVPADHITEIDHEMTLPNGRGDPAREWQGQRFVHNTPEGAEWAPFRLPGYIARDTTIAENTKGVAGVQVVRPAANTESPGWTSHEADILFGYVMHGALTLEAEGHDPARLAPGDAFTIPPGLKTRLNDPSDDLEFLEVTLPGRFTTHMA